MNASGQVSGINSSHLGRDGGLAVPSATVDRIVSALSSDGRIRRAYLGVASQPARLAAEIDGPINILAGAHTMMVVPNFYKLEFNHHALHLHNSFISPNLDIHDGVLHLPDTPGLGAELDVEFIEANLDPDWR